MDFRDDSPALFSISSLVILSLQKLPMIDVSSLTLTVCQFMYSLWLSTVQQGSQHSGIVDRALKREKYLDN